MIIFLFILDILIYNFTNFNSYFFLIGILISKKEDLSKFIFIGLFLDFIIFNKLLINTLLILLIFLLNKKIFKLKFKRLDDFIIINIFNLLLFNLTLALVNMNFGVYFFLNTLITHTIFYIISYKTFKKFIKLSR